MLAAIEYMTTNKKYFFFDMDGTICDSKQVIKYNMLTALRKLPGEIVVISGQSKKHMDSQLGPLECTQMPQSGNFMPMWQYLLSTAEVAAIQTHISMVRSVFRKYLSWKRTDYIENRGCQISFSFMGHGATYHDKMQFDPVYGKRKEVLKKLPFDHPDLECTIAGTTCFDYTRKDGKKGNNIQRYIEHMNWKKEGCIYFGDALFRGGNDESVIGVIDTVEVSDPEDLLAKLELYVR